MRAMIRMAGMVLLAAATVATAQRIEQDFNGGWRFAVGAQAGAEAPGFNDAAWTEVRVPHDWAIAGPFDPALDGNTGMLPWRGEGWYRKRFALPADAAGRRVILIFDGVMASPKVHVNGAEAGGWTYGYNSFWLDVTAHANPGAENVVAVHADTREHGSRWYPGAGIYRKVTLRIVDPVNVPVWGLWVTTPKVGDRAATARVRTEIANAGAADAAVEVETTLLDPTGAVAATRRDPVSA
ncbi:MAG: glycoside hydrolase family 2, partial [Lentisphaerae bacterium]|nr:glycoside hydrolase family 2 [Lentisphaerota bacterium]